MILYFSSTVLFNPQLKISLGKEFVLIAPNAFILMILTILRQITITKIMLENAVRDNTYNIEIGDFNLGEVAPY